MQVGFLQRIMVRLGETAVPFLQKVANHSDPSVRLLAVNPLAQIGGKNASEILKELLEDEDREVSRLVRRVLSKRKVFALSALDSDPEEKEVFRLELLGFVRIYTDKREITHTNWVRSKSRDLLILLAHLGGPTDKEKIIDAFWPEIPYRQANTLFHTTLHNLRRILEQQSGRKDLVLCRGGRYYLLPGSFFTDKQYFQELLAAVGHDDHPDEPSVSILEEAVGLFRGNYLEELDYTWVLPEQEYLRQLHNKARDRLSLHYLHKNDYVQAIIHLERLTQDNPFTEEYCHRLITAYAAIGDIQSVNLKYQGLRSVLSEELGLTPSKKIRELYNRLIAGC
jgi:LuxR family transcriptional regulator, maltose regulon positive regulatory protein